MKARAVFSIVVSVAHLGGSRSIPPFRRDALDGAEDQSSRQFGFFFVALPRLFSAWPGQSTGIFFLAVVDVAVVVVDVVDRVAVEGAAAVDGATVDGAVVGAVVVVRPVPDPEPAPDPDPV